MPERKPSPALLYELAWDLFSIVRCWDPGSCTGPERGRSFEHAFCKYCDRRGLHLTERPGARTLLYTRSASGFHHENDAVISTPALTVLVELKHLSVELNKNDLLVFNQKGLDFLLADDPELRRRPLFRILVSGTSLSWEARVFAAQWGILTVERHRLPLLALEALARRHFTSPPAAVRENAAAVLLGDVPVFVAPLQDRLRLIARALSDDCVIIGAQRIERILGLQDEVGSIYWRLLDRSDPTWIEDRYDATLGDTRADMDGNIVCHASR